MEPLVYYNAKLNHRGIVGYKVFENVYRKMHRHSLSNLLNVKSLNDATNKESGKEIETRDMSKQQSQKCRNFCDKLYYYSGTRKFSSKKKGSYNFRIAFLTLTCPPETTPSQSLAAFDAFLDYLRRTANAIYVWKKELGEEGKALHYHIMLNNFIPYYIVAWKWKRLLIAQGVEWPLNEKGKDTSSHYRIELPHNPRQASHYISKYMSKGHQLPKSYGYLFGKSDILSKLEEITIIETDLPQGEIEEIRKHSKVITHDYVTIVCCDLLQVKDYAPGIFSVFEEQYLNFSSQITLPQRFFDC
jgi:hypothetical protein